MADDPPEQSKPDQGSTVLAWVTQAVDEKSREAHAKLALDVENRINAQFDRDRKFITDVMAAALKVAGAGIFLVVIILGALTWTTYRNIHDSVIAAAKSGAEEKLKSPETKQTIDEVVDRGILDAYLLRIALHDSKDGDDKPLRDADLDIGRVIKLLTAEDTDRTTFESAAQVLLRVCPPPSADEVQDSRANSILNACAAIVRSNEKGFEWAAGKSDRRQILLQRMAKAELANDQTRAAARELLSLQLRVKPELRREAINYLGTIRDPEAIDALRELYNNQKSDEFRLDALRALVRLKADLAEVTKWCEQMLAEADPTIKVLGIAFDFSELVPPPMRERLIEFVSSKTTLTMNRRNREHLFLRSAAGSTAKRPQLIRVSKKPILGSENHGSDGVLNLLKKYSEERDIAPFTRFVKWLRPQSGDLIQVKMRLEGNSSIRLATGTLTNGTIPTADITLTTITDRAANNSLALVGTWTDPENTQNSMSGKIIELINPAQLKFSVSQLQSDAVSAAID